MYTHAKKMEKNIHPYYNYNAIFPNNPYNFLPPQFFNQRNNPFFNPQNLNLSMNYPQQINFLRQNNEKILYEKINNSSQISNFTIKPINQENRASFKCHPSDIYCLCKYHPKYHDCVCLAYPRSVACSHTFCIENPESYECNPQYCDKKDNLLHRNCNCKRNIESVGCKCKLNPLHKDCFCMKFPLSHICNDRICKFNPNSLFCKCNETPDDPICTPKYCSENPKSAQCECIVFPYNSNCRCLNDPNSCTNDQIKRKIIEYDMRIRGICNNSTNLTSDLNSTIYNWYYPPCIYDDKKPINSPCLPTPPLPKCDEKGNCLDKNSPPCLKKICKKNSNDSNNMRGNNKNNFYGITDGRRKMKKCKDDNEETLPINKRIIMP